MKRPSPNSAFWQFLGLLAFPPMAVLFANILLANPGENDGAALRSAEATSDGNSLAQFDTIVGRVVLSEDACGTTGSSCNVEISKPSGTAVRTSYLFCASTGFSNYMPVDGDVTVAGEPVSWDQVIANGVSSFNAADDVTDIVKPVGDAAPAGAVMFTIGETGDYDGCTLKVIWDDPAATENSILIFFGAQEPAGDTFVANFVQPLDPAALPDPLELSLGISFSGQPSPPTPPLQVSQVDVNGERLTTSAGGQDDGELANGALITAGGTGDTPDNPPPMEPPQSDRFPDDELYDLRPFIDPGDESITIFTLNPSGDDNIFVASLFLRAVTVITPTPEDTATPTVTGTPPTPTATPTATPTGTPPTATPTPTGATPTPTPTPTGATPTPTPTCTARLNGPVGPIFTVLAATLGFPEPVPCGDASIGIEIVEVDGEPVGQSSHRVRLNQLEGATTAKVRLRTPWNTPPDDPDTLFTIMDTNGDGKFDAGGRRESDSGTDAALTQQVTLTDFVDGTPTAIQLTEVNQRRGDTRMSTGGFVDTNGDGVMDAIRGQKDGTPEVLVSLVHADVNDDGKPDFVSIPWSQASLFGVDFEDDNEVPGSQGGRDPQIWVPLDQRGGVSIDLDGDGVADPQFFTLPVVAIDPREISCAGRQVTIGGTAASERIDGTELADVINGLDGDDTIHGVAGADVLCGGGGSDRMFGGRGKDSLRGGAGDDVLSGGKADDDINGQAGADNLKGQGGRDKLRGGGGDDTLVGGPGRDDCVGGPGSNRLVSCP